MLNMSIFLANQPFGCSPGTTGSLPCYPLKMTCISKILRSKASEFILGANLHMVVIPFACCAWLLSSPALRLCVCMLTRGHALPSRLRLFDILFGCLTLLFSRHKDLLSCTELNP